jgi:hypothetical protein
MAVWTDETEQGCARLTSGLREMLAEMAHDGAGVPTEKNFSRM